MSAPPSHGVVLAPGAYLRQAQLLSLLPFSAATLWRRVNANQFPKPVKLGPNVTAWEADAVRAWLEARKSEAA